MQNFIFYHTFYILADVLELGSDCEKLYKLKV